MEPALPAALDRFHPDFSYLRKNVPRKEPGNTLILRIQRAIRERAEDYQPSIRQALCVWLASNEEDKVQYAAVIIRDLSATECIPALENLRARLRTGAVPWPAPSVSYTL